jgi:hypothetical protein
MVYFWEVITFINIGIFIGKFSQDSRPGSGGRPLGSHIFALYYKLYGTYEATPIPLCPNGIIGNDFHPVPQPGQPQSRCYYMGRTLGR